MSVVVFWRVRNDAMTPMRTATVITRFVVTLQHFLELLTDY